MKRNEVKEILLTQVETLGKLANESFSEKDRCKIANSTARLAEAILQYDVQAPLACRIGRDGIRIGPVYELFGNVTELKLDAEDSADAQKSDPAKSFPEAAARALYEWMHEQMCGPVHTEWTYGNEHDAMDEAASFIDMLLWKYCDKDEFDEEGAT